MSKKQSSPETRDTMDAVRELLFGQKVEEIDCRFREQEASFKQTVDLAEERINERFKSMESFFKAELASATLKIKNNADKIQSEKESTSIQLIELTKRVDTDFENVQQQAAENHDESRKDAYSKFSELESKLAAAVRNLEKFTKEEVAGLRSSAADRQRMGDFMIDLGMRLQSDELKDQANSRVSESEESELGLAN